MHSGPTGIIASSVNGVIVRNNISDALAGIFDAAPAVRVSDNTLTNTSFGVLLLGGGTVQSNDISNANYGVFLNTDGATVQSNHITLATTAAVEFNCHSGVVSHNTINDVAVGLDMVPAGFHGFNSFANTGTITTEGCGAAPLMIGAARAQSRVGVQSGTTNPQQWRMPATPFGARK